MKKINLNELETACEVSYKGTLEEIIDMVANEKIDLLEMGGQIVGISVNTGLDYLQDQIAQKRFAQAYAGKPVMKWVAIAKMNAEGTLNVNEELAKSEQKRFTWEEPVTESVEEELPSEVDVTYEALDYDGDIAEVKGLVKNYLRTTYKHCLAKGSVADLEIEDDGELVHVSNIQWGRKLSTSELADL